MRELKVGEPIYIQIIENLKKQILDGILKANDKMPSVRELALSLAVNPNTIQKAYSILEREGYIYVMPGKGNFVRDNLDNIKTDEREKVLKEVKKKVDILLGYGMNIEEIVDYIKK